MNLIEFEHFANNPVNKCLYTTHLLLLSVSRFGPALGAVDVTDTGLTDRIAVSDAFANFQCSLLFDVMRLLAARCGVLFMTFLSEWDFLIGVIFGQLVMLSVLQFLCYTVHIHIA
jgi:hypothetical protein